MCRAGRPINVSTDGTLTFDIVDMWITAGRSRHDPRGHGSAPGDTRPGGSGAAGVYSGQHRWSRPNARIGIIGELAELGLVERREIGRTVVVSLARHSAAGEVIDRLAHLGSEVIARLRSLATELEPAPETLLIFGSFARGEADANSDLDFLAVRSQSADPEKWTTALSAFTEQAHELAGNRVQVLDYELDDLRRKAGPRARVGRDFWRALRHDAIVLAGSQLDDLIDSA